MRDVYDTAVDAGYDASCKRLLPLLTNFVSDTEPAVRQVFAEQLSPLATFFLENAGDAEAGYSEVSVRRRRSAHGCACTETTISRRWQPSFACVACLTDSTINDTSSQLIKDRKSVV